MCADWYEKKEVKEVQTTSLSVEDIELLKSFRKAVHRYPELGFEEWETTQRIAQLMERFEIPFHAFNDMTGGYVEIGVGAPRTIAFRADIDALPIVEKSGVDFASERDGYMHACGHDMHTTIAAGVARFLSLCRDQLFCNVVILFQPAEECNPASGAKRVIKSGVLEKLEVEEIYGLHLWPSLPVGHIAVRVGAQMGSSDHFPICVNGVKSHAAEPHRGVDALVIATEVYTALVHRLRREIPPLIGMLISIGLLNTSGRYNVICDEAVLEGTLRVVDPSSREYLHKRIPEIVHGIAATYRGKADVHVDQGFDVVWNDSGLHRDFVAYVEKHLDGGSLHLNMPPSLIGEDFSAYSRILPSLYFFLAVTVRIHFTVIILFQMKGYSKSLFHW